MQLCVVDVDIQHGGAETAVTGEGLNIGATMMDDKYKFLVPAAVIAAAILAATALVIYFDPYNSCVRSVKNESPNLDDYQARQICDMRQRGR